MRSRNGLLMLLLIGTSSLSANAQFSKGDRMAGATLGTAIYNSGSSDVSVAQIGNSKTKTTSYNLSISPLMGWFISDKTAVGGSMNINPTGSKVSYEQNGTTFQSDKLNSFNIGLGGFVRSYFGNSGKMLPFGQFGFNLGISNLKTEGFKYPSPSIPIYKETYEGSSSGGFYLNTSLQAGATKMMGENAGLDFFIGYTYGYNKNTFNRTTLFYTSSSDNNPSRGENVTTTKYTNHGFFLGVGFQVFLSKKK